MNVTYKIDQISKTKYKYIFTFIDQNTETIIELFDLTKILNSG